MLLEIAGEGGLLVEAEAVGDGLYARFRLVGERLFQLYEEVMLNPVASSMSGLLLYDAAEMLGREAEEVGIELHVAVLVAVFDDGIVEAMAQPLDVGGGGAYGGVVVVIDDLRQGVDATHQRVLAVLEVEAGDAAQGVDKG